MYFFLNLADGCLFSNLTITYIRSSMIVCLDVNSLVVCVGSLRNKVFFNKFTQMCWFTMLQGLIEPTQTVCHLFGCARSANSCIGFFVRPVSGVSLFVCCLCILCWLWWEVCCGLVGFVVCFLWAFWNAAALWRGRSQSCWLPGPVWRQFFFSRYCLLCGVSDIVILSVVPLLGAWPCS